MLAHARVRPYEDRFLEMLPQIQDQARFAFRDEPASRRQELVAETIANCWVAYVRLVERGLLNVIYPTPLVQYAMSRTCSPHAWWSVKAVRLWQIRPAEPRSAAATGSRSGCAPRPWTG